MSANNPLTICLLILSTLLALRNAVRSQPYSFVTAAGTAGKTGTADGTNSNARFLWPEGVAADAAGNIFVSDSGNNSIRRMSRSSSGWVVETLAGNPPFSGRADGTNNSAAFATPRGIAVATNGDLYVADYGNERIRKISRLGTNWVVTTLTLTGDGIWTPRGIAIDSAGNMFVTDDGNSPICRLTQAGTNWAVKIIAGTPGRFGCVDGIGTNAILALPFAIAIDRAGMVYVADNYNANVRMVSPSNTDWVVTTIVGSTNRILGNLDGTNSAAQFFAPSGIVVDSSGAILVADQGNSNIRKITRLDTNWMVTTIAGPGTGQNQGSSDGIGTDVRFDWPFMITTDQGGNLSVADKYNSTIRQGHVYQPAVHFTAHGRTIDLWWPTNAAGFQLEKSASPEPSATWAIVPDARNLSGTNYTLSTDTTQSAAFYRLHW